MLKNLLITNYALIEKLDIDFSTGFSVITGETGAGKSIILGALGLLMGQRADAKAIKAGEKKCSVEATFDVHELHLEQFFADYDIDFDGRECIIRREVVATGKSRAFINDTPVQLAVLKEISAAVIDIHSQHQNLLMGHEHFLIDVLDTVAGNDALQAEYLKNFTQWHDACTTLEQLMAQQAQDQASLDFLQFQFNQLEEANLQDGEQETLEAESEMLSHAEEIKMGLYEAAGILSDEGRNTIGLLKQASQALSGVAGVFNKAESLYERIDSTRIELEDIASELERLQEQVEFDPARQTFVDDRLATIYELQKKHHVDSIKALLEVKENIDRQLNNIENSDEVIRETEKRIATYFESMQKCGKQLTANRQKAAAKTTDNLRQTLVFLGMPNVSMHFEIKPRTAPDTTGFDAVTFLFSANKNVPEQDVTQIASGGEIARLMLALKTFLSKSRNLPTIIFDEIDTGVSGTIAEKMAQVMQEMAKSCQVICITHLPQIAALGSQHYRVYKSETTKETTSHIVRLNTEERIEEIANMLSGAQMTEAAINNAKSLLGLD